MSDETPKPRRRLRLDEVPEEYDGCSSACHRYELKHTEQPGCALAPVRVQFEDEQEYENCTHVCRRENRHTQIPGLCALAFDTQAEAEAWADREYAKEIGAPEPLGHVVPNSGLDVMIGTQAAAEILNISRPTVVRFMDRGDLPFTRAPGKGAHRRALLRDVLTFQLKLRRRADFDPFSRTDPRALSITEADERLLSGPPAPLKTMIKVDICEEPHMTIEEEDECEARRVAAQWHDCQEPQALWVELETGYTVQVLAPAPQAPGGFDWEDCGRGETSSAQNAAEWLVDAKMANRSLAPDSFRVIETLSIRRLISMPELSGRAKTEKDEEARNG